MKILGAKRIFMLSLLAGINILCALVVYSFFVPEEDRLNRQWRVVRGEVAKLRNDIADFQVEMKDLESQREAFEALRQAGFFERQSRRLVEDVLKEAQDVSQVTTAFVNVQPGEVEFTEFDEKTGHYLLVSRIQIEIKALNDKDIYQYISILKERFPGHVSVKNMDITRKIDVNRTLLRSIASNNNPELVRANILMSWRTMIPQNEVVINEQN